MNMDMSLDKPIPQELQGRHSSSNIETRPDPAKLDLKGERKKLYETAQKFQALFMDMMLDSMRKTVNKEDNPLYGGNRQDIFEDMLYDEYSQQLSQTPGMTLATDIYYSMESKLPKERDISELPQEVQEQIRKFQKESYEKSLPSSISTDQIQQEWMR
ncbi:MAG TPA: cell division protein [Leptospiraceae bacterium]|nr:cell division protein [Spirochaetaceae bacterium]HBS05528.1 cell division protein [Leptospiraceae bacterium]|tara:strand:+ start:52229 stop:52702 length:474 start_codon:yes stop_codon:yes gene_type:complete